MMFNWVIYILTLSFYGYLIYLRMNKHLYKIDLNIESITQYYNYLWTILLISFSILMLITVSLAIKPLLEKHINNNKVPSSVMLKIAKVFSWYKKLNFTSRTYGFIFDLVGPQYTRHLISLAKYCLTLSKKKT